MKLNRIRSRSKYRLLFLLLIFCFTDCKKYEEGPWISLRTKKARLTGDWEPIQFTANGIDSLSWLKSDTCYGYYLFMDHKENAEVAVIQTSDISASCYNWGHFKLVDNKEKLKVNFSSAIRPTILGPYGAKEDVEWDILRLTNKELWLKTAYKGILYQVKFKKVYERK